MAGRSQNGDCCVVQGCQVLRTGAASHATPVFSKSDVAHPMQAIFDSPVTTVHRKQFRRCGSLTRKARDRVGYFGVRLTITGAGPFDTNGLGKAGPIEMSYQSVARLKRADLNFALAFVDIATLIKRLLPNALAVKGFARA